MPGVRMPRLSMNDAAKLCGRARSTIQRAVARGTLPRGADGLVDTADLVAHGYLDAGHEDDPIPHPTSVTIRMLYDLNLTILSVLRDLSTQLAELLTLLRPEAGQPPARPKKRPQRPLCPG